MLVLERYWYILFASSVDCLVMNKEIVYYLPLNF